MRQRIDSFRYAINGFRLVLKTEINMKIHVIAAVLVSIFGFLFSISVIEWIVVLICFALVLGAEIGNTVVEKYLDEFHPERSPTIGAIKDMSAAAVLVIAFFSAVIGLIIFVPKIILLF